MVEFAGWELPLHCGSQVEEHHAVRRDAGMFDVSHMTVTDLAGAGARDLLRGLLTNDVDRLGPGGALYSCMLNEQAGVIDDLIVYQGDDPGRYRVVSNASTRRRVLSWLGEHASGRDVVLRPHDDLAMIAVQGPSARGKVHACVPADRLAALQALQSFEALSVGDWQLARTGYTGEDGYEVVLPARDAPSFWQRLRDQGVRPCGLGARDTLRLEAGLRLYGNDMDESVTPLSAGLGWTIAWQPDDRFFIGRGVLGERQRASDFSRFSGLLLEEPGVLRSHQRVRVPGGGEGVVTSGGFSPTLDRSIGLARLPQGSYASCEVEIRGVWKRVRLLPPRFVRVGRSLVEGVPAVH